MLKNAVRLMVHRGAKIEDSNGPFNADLEAKAMCDIDFHKVDEPDEAVLKELVRAAVDHILSRDKKK